MLAEVIGMASIPAPIVVPATNNVLPSVLFFKRVPCFIDKKSAHKNGHYSESKYMAIEIALVVVGVRYSKLEPRARYHQN